jgi:DNA-binding CsgD family transcriptional regulator
MREAWGWRAAGRDYVVAAYTRYRPIISVALEKRVLLLIGEVIGLLDLNEFCDGLLQALREAVPADWCALNEVPADPPHTISLTDPPVPAEIHHAFARYASQNPIAAHFLRTRDGRATRFSDLITRRQLHRLDLYRQVYQPLAAEYQIAFTLPSGAERILGVALSRGKRDFTATERDLLNLARPYLIQAYRNALAHTALDRQAGPSITTSALQALGLTRRQAEVLRLIAMGHSSQRAAAALGIAERTAQKHLEHCYRTLNVTNRSQASQLAWATAT